MDILRELRKIEKWYRAGGNINEYVRAGRNAERNSAASVLVSYDFQAGAYTEYAERHPRYIRDYAGAIAKTIEALETPKSVLEIGAGEATTLANVVARLKKRPDAVYGFDISWSRIKFAKRYCRRLKVRPQPFLFVGALFHAPFQSSSIDVVYTSHSIEPNGGKERQALLESYRICRNHLVLLEPAYELAGAKARKRMEKHGYARNLYRTAKSLGFKVIEHRLFDYSANPLNPTGLMIIEKKNAANAKGISNPLACPITKLPLLKARSSFYCKEGMLAYPVVEGIPCLLPSHAVVATHFLDR